MIVGGGSAASLSSAVAPRQLASKPVTASERVGSRAEAAEVEAGVSLDRPISGRSPCL